MLLLVMAVIPLLSLSVTAQSQETRPLAKVGKLERITVHGESLVGNLAGDTPDRLVSVYLPPSYAASPKRRYPVLYLLHGFTDSDDHWFGLSGPALRQCADSGKQGFCQRIARIHHRDAQRLHPLPGQHVLQLGGDRRLGGLRGP